MIINQEEWDMKDKLLRDCFNQARNSGDAVNRYITHNEVMEVLFDRDPELLTHQFVEVFERGLVRNHSKSIKKCLEMLETMRHPDEDKKDRLRQIADFLDNHKPSKGRASKVPEFGTNKIIRINKNQGYALIPHVAQIFELETDEDGKYDDQSVIVHYEDKDTITISRRTPLTDPDMLDDM